MTRGGFSEGSRILNVLLQVRTLKLGVWNELAERKHRHIKTHVFRFLRPCFYQGDCCVGEVGEGGRSAGSQSPEVVPAAGPHLEGPGRTSAEVQRDLSSKGRRGRSSLLVSELGKRLPPAPVASSRPREELLLRGGGGKTAPEAEETSREEVNKKTATDFSLQQKALWSPRETSPLLFPGLPLTKFVRGDPQETAPCFKALVLKTRLVLLCFGTLGW